MTPGKHADSKDTAPGRLGHFLEPLKHPSHGLLVAIWQDQYYVQGRIGRQRPKGRLHLLAHCLVETSATAEQHAGIRANPCLHLVSRLNHAPDPFCPWWLSRMSRRRRRRRARLCTNVENPSWPILHVVLCVADELLALSLLGSALSHRGNPSPAHARALSLPSPPTPP